MEDIKEVKTCRLMDWNTLEPCGAKTTSRQNRLDHVRDVHTPSAAQWTEAYKTVEKNNTHKRQ